LMGHARERTLTKDGRAIDIRQVNLQDLIDAGIMFCGTPDQVYRQMVEFIDYTGGLGHFLSMTQAGFLSHADTVDSLTLFGKEVLPRLKDYKQPATAEAAE
jgi:alkanesulfonate monooxygenase SsuD/methylene tetrahydromethanopterin reductase-like flavin-dependent oxidoreductase (luciferase family)